MASETRVGTLVVDLQARTIALEKGLETARKKLKEIEKQNEEVQVSNKQLDASFIAMSASIVASLVKIKSAIDDGIEKYKEYKKDYGNDITLSAHMIIEYGDKAWVLYEV